MSRLVIREDGDLNGRDVEVDRVIDVRYLKNIAHEPIKTKIIGRTYDNQEAIKASDSKRSYKEE